MPLKNIVITFLLFLSGTAIYAQDALEGFDLLKIPKAAIPVGAEWIEGKGPVGNATVKANIVKNTTSSGPDISKLNKDKIDLAVLAYLKLDPSFAKKITITYTGITTNSVKELQNTQVRSGQYVIYSSVAAASISFKYKKDIAAAIEARLKNSVKELKTVDSSASGKTISFNGENMVFAYQVFKLGKMSFKDAEGSIIESDDKSNILPVKVFSYNFDFNCSGFLKCVNEKNKDELCNVAVAYKLTDSANMNSSGAMTTTDSVYNNKNQIFSLSKIQNNTLIADEVQVSLSFKSIVSKDPKQAAKRLISVTGTSKVKIRRMITEVTILPNPSAPGW